MSVIKKLQVVDAGEFNKFIAALRKTHEEDTVLNKATSNPEKFSFLEAEKTLKGRCRKKFIFNTT